MDDRRDYWIASSTCFGMGDACGMGSEYCHGHGCGSGSGYASRTATAFGCGQASGRGSAEGIG